MAATIVNANEWDSGIALMQAANSDGWEQLAADANLVSANRDKIVACRNAATKAKKEKRCIITVPAP
jgi:hypothetical protein